ncbi:MAG: Gfo/Idh/MocA family oxidoreductase [Acidimicrobiales bacterium]
MSRAPSSAPGPGQVLIVSSRLTGARRPLLAGLAPPGARVDLVEAGADLPDPAGYTGVVIDGPADRLPPAWATSLLLWVDGGGSVVAIGAAPAAPSSSTGRAGPASPAGPAGPWAELLGSTAGPAPAGPAEWFVKVDSRAQPVAARVPAEFPVTDSLVPLRPHPRAEVVLSVNVAFRDEPALVTLPRGAGRVSTAGLGNDDRGLAHPDLALVLRRCLATGGGVGGGDRSLGLAVVGYGPYGGMGQYHGRAARSTPGLDFIATCDADPYRRKAAEADFPGLRAYASVDELATDPDVEVVVVATPPVSHASVALALLRAGKHVALEKPMCFTVAEADRLIAAAGDHGLALTVNQNRRWDPDFRAVRRAVEADLLGEVFNIETFVGGFEHPCRAWHSEETVSGGAVYDWGSHHLDWTLQLMGSSPSRVVAHGHKRVWHDVTNLDQLRVHLDWEDGREAEFVQSDVAAVRRPKFYLQGTAGTLVGHYRPLTFERVEEGRGYVAETAHHAEAPADLTLVRYESGWGLTETHLPPLPEHRHAFHRNLADHLHRGEPLAVTPESVRPVIAVLEAARDSARDGGTTVSLAAS